MQEPLIERSTNESYEEPKAIVIEEQSVAIPLIQRRLWVGYNAALSLMNKLEAEGIVSPLDPLGTRQLASLYIKRQPVYSNMNPNLLSMLDKFDGSQGSDPGSTTASSIWLFGVEPGWSKFDQENTETPANPMDDGYSIETQRQWSYNRNAFRLLAAIDGIPVAENRAFAIKHQPFSNGSTGYFKGNLHPYPPRFLRISVTSNPTHNSENTNDRRSYADANRA